MAKCGGRVFWLAVLLALTVIMGAMLISGDVLLYLAPRMVPMVWFGFAVLAVLCVHQGAEIVLCLRGGAKVGKARFGTLLFLIPILFILTAPPDAAAPGALPNQTVRLQTSGSAGAAQPAADAPAATVDYPPCVLEDERAFFNPDADLFEDYLRETVEDLDGRTVTLYGFVYRDESFAPDVVLVSRQMITCCAADASIVGFHVQVDPEIDLQLNEWIRVTGTIKTKNILYYEAYHDFPVLTDGLILRCDAPGAQDAYVYP